MRQRLIFGVFGLVVILAMAAFALGGGDDDPATQADREVEDEWDSAAAIRRTQIIAAALDDDVGRTMASCMLAAAEEAAIDLDRLAEFDLSASTASGATAAEAEVMADALLECGPSVGSLLSEELPGSPSIPASHAEAGECLRTAYREGLRAAYVSRFRSNSARGPHDVDIVGPLRDCEAAAAVILGASEEGLLDAAALSTLEWKCLSERLPTTAFQPIFEFPDDPGDALERMGADVAADVAFCEAWVDGQPVTG